LHRGTLTTQAYVKWANRRLEHKLRALEMLCSCLPLEKYPQAQIDEIWKTVLLNQFHDIIPGSSIWRVYKVTHVEYRDALEKCEAITASASAELFEKDPDSITLFNSLQVPYEGAVLLPENWENCGVADAQGNLLPSQIEDGRILVKVTVPSHSFQTLTRTVSLPPESKQTTDLVLENDLVRYEFDANGALLRCFDKELNIEIVSPDRPANVLTVYEDRPNDWDAWDIDSFYRDVPLATAKAGSARACESGAVRQGLHFAYLVGISRIEQTVRLGKWSRRLDFETTVDWHEKHRMLRVAFPVGVRSNEATFDIQYGFLKRPTHSNTSWEQAKFEVVGHRYADLSNQDHGVALLNDCKYGYRVEDGLLDLNLLRSPNYPDPDADQGEHHFTYCLLPHKGDLVNSDVMAEAARLNQGIMVFDGLRAKRDDFPVRLTGDGLSLGVVKKAEKENCLIVRLAETRGCHSTGRLTVTISGAYLEETDLLEWANGIHIPANQPIDVSLKPFEIRTYKLRIGTV
jgi:alpha-mannosidase